MRTPLRTTPRLSGLARLANKQQAEGINDLSKAGELGLYTAYSIIKRQRK